MSERKTFTIPPGHEAVRDGEGLATGEVRPCSADIVERLRKHVNNRGGPSLENGAWQMMLDAADTIEALKEANNTWVDLHGPAPLMRDAAQAAPKPFAELAARAGRFQEGTKRIYDGKSDHGGDMWFFELFHFLADVQTALAAQPPAAPVGRGCCNKCRNPTDCELGCKLACNCGGGPGQPASEHDISCPAALARCSAGSVDAVVLEEVETLRGHTVRVVSMPDGSEETHILPHPSPDEYLRCMEMLRDFHGDTLEDRIERLISSHLELLSRDEPQGVPDRASITRIINGIYGIGSGTYAGGHQDKSIARAVDAILAACSVSRPQHRSGPLDTLQACTCTRAIQEAHKPGCPLASHHHSQGE